MYAGKAVTATFALEDTGYEVYLPERLIAQSTLASVRLSLEYSLLLADRSSWGRCLHGRATSPTCWAQLACLAPTERHWS